MKIFTDLHVHSKYARATSKNLNIDNLEKWGKIKGLDVIGTGDFQHPIHWKDINEKLMDNGKGIFVSKKGFNFILQTEISLMYYEKGRRRAIHLVVLAGDKRTAEKIIEYLKSKGRIDYDGRPIFGIPSREFVKDLKAINEKIEIIPAHCMTPWFGLFGSKSGFDSLKECFKDMSDKIYALESGMSADPGMLWRFKEVIEGKVNIISFSDAHSAWPWRIGREATIFNVQELSYDEIIKGIREGDGIIATIETPPEYGKYHYDGHRNCNFSCSYEETKRLKGKCPKCGNDLTIGVDFRVEELANEKKGFKAENGKDYYKIVPLHELIAFYLKSNITTKRVWNFYNRLINVFKNEINILLNIPKEHFLEKEFDKNFIDLIILNRKGDLKIKPGYDGVYGEIVFENVKEEKQAKLF